MRENISAFINSRRLIAVFAILTIMFGGLWMAHTQMNRIPDLWEHVYRVSGITNGDIVARPVTSVSDYHRIAADNYGGRSIGNGSVYPISIVTHLMRESCN